MATQALDIRCPNCKAPVSTDQIKCKFCRSPITVSSFSNVTSMTGLELNKYVASYKESLSEHPDDRTLNMSVALCYMKLKMYDEAYAAFSKAIADNFDYADSYFYAAVCLLKGRKAFLLSRPEIDKILELMNAATMIEERGVFFYFLAYIKFDYFKRKFLNTTPSYKDYLALAKTKGCSPNDESELFVMLGVDKPNMI